MDNRWTALRTVAAIFKILAYIGAVVVVIYALALLLKGSSAISLLANLIGGAIIFLYLYATAESILVFLAIEENTKKTADAIEARKPE